MDHFAIHLAIHQTDGSLRGQQLKSRKRLPSQPFGILEMTTSPERQPAPAVSFVVPCYKLAHLLPECINSILAQTYQDFEILIMDDDSPDATPEVASSFNDPRVRHVRNTPNLGHLRNYNKGIALSRGKYVWLISADDYLARPYILERYVSLMDSNPRVGYAFCPGIAVGGGTTVGISAWVAHGRQVHGTEDRILAGHSLLRRLLAGNTIVAASGLVRRECYERHGSFPLDMPWAGDWYLWCLFALYHDVAYFAEAMVCYREHELSMSNKYARENPAACCEEEVVIPFAIKEKADEAGFSHIARSCLSAIAEVYTRAITTSRYGMSSSLMDFSECEESLRKKALTREEHKRVMARIHANIGDAFFSRGQRELACESYRTALMMDWKLPTVLVKSLLLSLGRPGDCLRKRAAAVVR